MIYEHRCVKCEQKFDVVKSVKDIDVNEFCPHDGAPAERVFVPTRVYFSGATVTHAEYNPGLGCVVKNKAHKDDICKRRGLVEIGNDFKKPDTIHKTFSEDREAKRKKRWESDD